MPGIGFAVGIERILLLLENIGVKIPRDDTVRLYIAPMGEEAEEKAFVLTDKLRKAGVITETDHMGRGIKAQFKYADKIGAEYVGVIGSDELSRGEIKLKKMSDGTEISVSFDNLAEYFGKKPI